LQGGSLGGTFALKPAPPRASHIYRAVHGISPAVSITHCAKSIHTLPTAEGERSLIQILSSPALLPKTASSQCATRSAMRAS
jgi:hypothetical protein